MPQETNTSKIGALEKSVTTLVTVTAQLRAEVDAFKTDLKSSEAAAGALDKENAVLKQKIDDLTRRHDDQAAHFKVWDQRWWGFTCGSCDCHRDRVHQEVIRHDE